MLDHGLLSSIVTGDKLMSSLDAADDLPSDLAKEQSSCGHS